MFFLRILVVVPYSCTMYRIVYILFFVVRTHRVTSVIFVLVCSYYTVVVHDTPYRAYSAPGMFCLCILVPYTVSIHPIVSI